MIVHSPRWGSILLLLSLLACADGAERGEPPKRGDDDEAVPELDPSSSAARDAGSANASTDSAIDASAPTSSGEPAERDGGRAGSRDAAVARIDASRADAAASSAGDKPEVDGGAQPGSSPLDTPPPVAAPLIWGFGLGITDMANAVRFYTEVMKMTVEKANVVREVRTETFLYAGGAKRGARIILMQFDDGRNTRKISAKLVFQASNTRAVNAAAAMFPDYVSRLNLGIVQFDGPETYVHEVGGIFDSGGRGVDVPYPIAMGFATSDLAASRRFYTALGMEESRTGAFSVTDASGSGNITEYSVKFATGSGLVLQAWTPMRNAKDNPIKVVLFVPDAKALADKVVAAGGSIVEEAERAAAYDNRLTILAKDPDGYLLELVQ